MSNPSETLSNIKGIWQNAAGSQLEFEADYEGSIHGAYKTALGSADHSKTYPLSGQRSGRALSFCVAWGPESESATAWTALIVEGAPPRLEAMWTLVRANTVSKSDNRFEERPTAPWEAFLVQSAQFLKVQT